jgi:hypothetical protein
MKNHFGDEGLDARMQMLETWIACLPARSQPANKESYTDEDPVGRYETGVNPETMVADLQYKRKLSANPVQDPGA